MRRLAVLLAAFAAVVALAGNAIAQNFPPPLGPTSFALNGSAQTLVVLRNFSGQSFCTVAVNSSSTMGSGTITIKTTSDNGASWYAVSGVADLGFPASPAPSQTITSAGTALSVPVSGKTGLELVLSGATAAVITGTVTCNSGSGVVAVGPSGVPGTTGPSGPPGPTGSPGAAGSAAPTICPSAGTGIGVTGSYPCTVGLTASPPPQVMQLGIKNGTGATGTVSLPTTAASPDVIVGFVQNLAGNTLTTPSGWTAVATSGSNPCALTSFSQIGAYYRTASGTNSDNLDFVQASGTSAWSGIILELSNAGTPTGFACTTQSSVGTWASPTVAGSVGDLIMAYESGVATPSITSPNQWEMAGWSNMQYDSANLGQNFYMETLPLNAAVNVTEYLQYGATQSGLSVILRVPAKT